MRSWKNTELENLINQYNELNESPAQSPEEYNYREQFHEKIRQKISGMDWSFMHKEAVCPYPPQRDYYTEEEQAMIDFDNELKEI